MFFRPANAALIPEPYLKDRIETGVSVLARDNMGG